MERRVALVGMYGGYFAERNPGCFLILEASLRALQRRLPDTSFDIYSHDTIARHDGVRTETIHGRTLHFFAAHETCTLLEGRLSQYAALVLGGDIILAPPPAPSVFLLESPAFLATTNPLVFYNAAHTSLSAEYIQQGPQAVRFRRMCERAAYVAVRTEYARDALRTLGSPEKVEFCPDPTLCLDLSDVLRGIEPPRIESDKKVLGVSVMAHFIEPLIEALLADAAFTDEYEVWLYPYSRQYNHIEAVLRIQRRYGDRFKYIDYYQDPLDTFAFMAQFDASINDTFHGTIAALLLGIPFLVIDREDTNRSRNRNMLSLFGLEDRIMASARHGITRSPDRDDLILGDALVDRWAGALDRLRDGSRQQVQGLAAAQAIVDAHFDRIAETILASEANHRSRAPSPG